MLDYYDLTMPEDWRGNVRPEAMLMRRLDYGCRPDDRHGYKSIGIFDKVYIETPEHAELSGYDLEVNFPTTGLDLAEIVISLDGKIHDDSRLSGKVVISESDGSNSIEENQNITQAKGIWKAGFSIKIENPKLWWPKNYGDQPLYKAEIEIYADGKLVIKESRSFGIRKLRKMGNMVFEFNDVPVRFWGGNFAPIWGPSNTFNPEYTYELIEKVNLMGANAVRIWGGSQPYPDAFYDKFDRMGIMVWQDFPTVGSQLPDSDKYRDLLGAEVEFMVKKLKHHPSIYLWCGGNENIYMCQFRGETKTHGFNILTNLFRDICAKHDPQRYYHASCPYEGRYVNDPMTGDTHGGRALRSFCAGEDYGAFFSENIRTYPPQYKSFHRWLGDKIWESDYVDIKPFGCEKPMPKSWHKLLTTAGETKFGPIWDYYSATNIHELIYKFTAAAGQDIYQMYARSRRGNPPDRNYEGQFCRGHIIWKINDPWPNFYCALVDYYLEPSLPYYTVKRAIRPVWIDIEVGDHIYLWGVNDTRNPVTGNADLTLYSLEAEETIKKVAYPVALLPGSSQLITNLDSFGFLRRYILLHVQLKDSDGNIITTANNYLNKENMLGFHDSKLNVTKEDETLTITTDKFARCVELSAGKDGCEFGWVFEDNYFDLFPFEVKKVGIQRRGKGGCIRAKAQYSDHIAFLNL
jgi:hypothetical protein